MFLSYPFCTHYALRTSLQPASLRPANLASFWSLLSKFLAGSNAHDQNTCNTIFHEIVSILGAFVRLRRDLILNTLPHLCIALRQLLLCLRGPRPHLGSKQLRLVSDTLPMWINPSQPLGVDESKALARLLTTLAVKSTLRTHASTADAQKPESLARPLSKHVAYVIQAYVGALNDPLCVMPLDVRRELQPGLFILCDMLHEHGRDALMVSALDAGGKAVMKSLWRDYEKQRYVGKG
jgi:Urb2/Npa2 family